MKYSFSQNNLYIIPDPAVMQAWAEDQGIAGSFVNMMGDPAAELTKALDVEMVHPGPPSVGIIGRCKRHAMIVDDGEVKWFAISEDDDDPAGDGEFYSRPDTFAPDYLLVLCLV